MRISDWSSDVCSSDLGEHSLTPDVYAAIRRECGGVAAVPGGIGDEAGRTPAVVAASRATILPVLKAYKHFTVETQLDRLGDTGAPTHVPPPPDACSDDPRPQSDYPAASARTNAHNIGREAAGEGGSKNGKKPA